MKMVTEIMVKEFHLPTWQRFAPVASAASYNLQLLELDIADGVVIVGKVQTKLRCIFYKLNMCDVMRSYPWQA